MSWFGGLFSGSSESNEEEDDSGSVDDPAGVPDHDKPCNVSGHDWQPAYSPNYYARSKAFQDNVMRFKKETHETCSKCDNYRNSDEWIGKVKIDKETDELSVVQ